MTSWINRLFQPSIYMRALVQDMNSNPQDYMQAEYTLVHRPTGLQIWTSNGMGHFGIYLPNKQRFSRRDQYAFRKAWNNWLVADRISKMRIMLEAGA